MDLKRFVVFNDVHSGHKGVSRTTCPTGGFSEKPVDKIAE
jgi:hypothetical protein